MPISSSALTGIRFVVLASPSGLIQRYRPKGVVELGDLLKRAEDHDLQLVLDRYYELAHRQSRGGSLEFSETPGTFKDQDQLMLGDIDQSRTRERELGAIRERLEGRGLYRS